MVAQLAVVLDPVVSAAALSLWLPASLLVRSAQDDPAGPAPVVVPVAVTRLAGLVGTGLLLAAGQLAVAVGVVLSGLTATVSHAAWTALAATTTAAALVAVHALPVLRRQRAGRAETGSLAHAAAVAAVRSAAVAGVVALLLATTATAGGTGGPTVLPSVLAGVAVLLAWRVLQGAALTAAPRRASSAVCHDAGHAPGPRLLRR